jgi:hypothetical protein
LPDAPRGLGCRTVLDLAEHRYDVGCGDILDRGGAEVGKHVPFQCMEHVIGVLFDPMPLVHVMPFASDDLERASSIRDDLQAPEPLLDSGVLTLPEEALRVGGDFSRFGESDRRVWTDREQLLLALELVPETP